MYNKKVLQTAVKELDKAKAPAKRKDIITDPMGQWKYPGQVTRIPSDTITMQGVNYPVYGVPDKGQPVLMQPGANYDFPGANYVDEYPQMKRGGGLKSKKYTRNIEGTNRFFAESALFKKPKKLSKKRIFDPNAKYFQEGGELVCPPFHKYDSKLNQCVAITEEEKAASGKKFMQDWVESPRAKEMLQASVQKDKPNKDVTQLTKNVATLRRKLTEGKANVGSAENAFSVGYAEPRSLDDMIDKNNKVLSTTMYDPNLLTYRTTDLEDKPVPFASPVNFFTKGLPGNHAYVYPHEYSHNQDMAGDLIPKSDKELIDKYKDVTNVPQNELYQKYAPNGHWTPESEKEYDKELAKAIKTDYPSRRSYQTDKKLYETNFNKYLKDNYLEGEYNNSVSYDEFVKSQLPDSFFVSEGGKPGRYGTIDQKLRYLTNPTETRARLNAVRMYGKEYGIYDPFTEKVTPETYQKLLEIHDQQNPNEVDANQLRQLKSVYTDEQILDMMNTISKNNNSNEELNFAANGGSTNDYIEADLTDEEIEEYAKGGFIIEDISVPQLTQAQKGIIISDPKEYAYRKQMYDDSLTLYNQGLTDKKWLNSQTPIKKYSDGDHIYKGTEWNKYITKRNKKFEDAWDRLKKTNKKDPKGKLRHLSVSNIMNGKDDPTPMNSSHTYFTNYKKPVQPVYFKDDMLNEKVTDDDYDKSLALYNKYERENEMSFPNQKMLPIEPNGEYSDWSGKIKPIGYYKKIMPDGGILMAPAFYKKPVKPAHLKNSDVDLLPLKKLEAKQHNKIIESKVQQRKQSDYKTAYRDQTIVSYDPTIKQFIQTGSRKAPLPYSEKIGTKDWELNTSQEIPESGPLVWQVNGKDYYNQEEAKKAQAFMPQGSYNFETGGEADDYMDLELTDDEIQQYARGGYIVEELPEAQEGKETGVESYTPWQNAPEEYAPYVTNMEEVPVVAEAAPWAKLSNEYEKKNSKQAFIESKKRDYLKKTNKGLSKMAGLSLDNFPKDVASNFADEYEYKKNNYVTKKLGNQKGFNPRRRDEWVDELTPGERNVVANSKYGSKLQPGYWNRALAGVQELGNTVLPGQPLQYNIPGLTKKEQKEMRDSKLSALEMFAPMDIPGAITANYLKNNGISTGSNFKNQPAFYSGEKMSNVTDADATALNPLTYIGLEAIPELGMNLVKGAKALPGAIKTSKESGLLSNAYKINPLAFKPNPEAYYRMIGKEGYADALESGMVRPPQTTRIFDQGSQQFIDIPMPAYDDAYYNSQFPLDRRWYPNNIKKTNPEKAALATKSGYQGPYMAEVTGDSHLFERGENVAAYTGPNSHQTVTYSKEHIPITNSNLKFYKEHWLHGYKEVPKELPGSPNTLQTPAGFQNRVFDSNIQLGSFKGKGHLSEKGYNYRTLGDAEIKAIQESKGVFPKTGKAKGGNENVKYWTKGNEKNWYAENPNQQVIRIKDNKFSTDKVADANDIEIYNHETGAFESIIPKPATIKSGIGGIDMSRYEIKNPDYFTQLLDTYDNKALSSTNKKFYKDLIGSVKKQNGLVTERQYNELQRLKTGNFNFGKKGYADGGNVNNYTELELTAKEIKNYIDNGYIIEDID